MGNDFTLMHAVDYLDGKLDYLIKMAHDAKDAASATRRNWRAVTEEHPDCGEPTTTMAAMHSRYVLVRRDGFRYFVAQYWVRLLDGAVCWIPAYTHEHVQVADTDKWIPLEEVG